MVQAAPGNGPRQWGRSWAWYRLLYRLEIGFGLRRRVAVAMVLDYSGCVLAFDQLFSTPVPHLSPPNAMSVNENDYP